MIVATAGHIDHGKTQLLKALTGVDTDRLIEEKQRGMSIDLGFAYKDLGGGCSLSFVDVPGHERFIRNMLAGVAGIDFALMVIAADDGPMPQTKEHLSILNLLGIQRGTIALSKIDKVNPERLDEVKKIITKLLQNTSLSKAPIFPLSSKNKKGVNNLLLHLKDEARKTLKRKSVGNFRLAVDRSFKVKGAGMIVTGSIFSGNVTFGEQLVISPKGKNVLVRAIHSQNQVTNRGFTGQRCALNISGKKIDLTSINRGDWIMAKHAHFPTKRLDAKIIVLPSEQKPFKNGATVHLHLGTSHITCRIAVLQKNEIMPGCASFVQLVLDKSISAVFGDRFILRDQSAKRTIAGGKIIDPFPLERGRNRSERIKWLKSMSIESSESALLILLKQMCWGIDLSKFARARNLRKIEMKEICSSLPVKKVYEGDNLWGILTENWDVCLQLLIDTINHFHKQSPNSLGINEGKLAQLLKVNAPYFVVNKAIKECIDLNKIFKTGKTIHLQEHIPNFSFYDEKLWKKLHHILKKNKFHPPTVSELALDLDIGFKRLEMLLHQATELQYIIKINRNRYFVPSSLLSLAQKVETIALEAKNGEFNIASFRNSSGIGRNLTIEVLEFFDKMGFTKRLKTGRLIKKSSKEVFQNFLKP